jgi:hypothetical protein
MNEDNSGCLAAASGATSASIYKRLAVKFPIDRTGNLKKGTAKFFWNNSEEPHTRPHRIATGKNAS